MPIYAYKCSSCGHAQDVLQKISDEPLTVCPACNDATYAKQVTAAGFQLKGSGWYVTDFRDGNKKTDKKGDGAEAKPAEAGKDTPSTPSTETASTGTETKAATPAGGKPAAPVATSPTP